jgi:soluble epoxide hydrolase/lipid-phosphate phosphatase
MDSALYKTHAVSRGLKYHYFFTPAQDKKPVLLLLHGFPSTSYDWHRLVATFRSQGYGVLVPDLLGYGGTDKPHDVAEYRLSLMVRDIVDLLDAENVQHAVSIGHDWCVWCC